MFGSNPQVEMLGGFSLDPRKKLRKKPTYRNKQIQNLKRKKLSSFFFYFYSNINDKTMSLKKIFDYCEELVGADLLDERSAKKLQKAKDEAKRNMAKLYFLLDELAGADLLPEGDEENGFENCENILELFDF